MGKTQSTLIPSVFDKRPYVQMTINKQVIPFLYDTSAEHSSIDFKLFFLLNIERTNAKEQFRYHLNSFGKIKKLYYSICDVSCSLHSQDFVFSFHVFPNKHSPAVLGLDFIHAFKLSYCPLNKRVLFLFPPQIKFKPKFKSYSKTTQTDCIPMQAHHYVVNVDVHQHEVNDNKHEVDDDKHKVDDDKHEVNHNVNEVNEHEHELNDDEYDVNDNVNEVDQHEIDDDDVEEYVDAIDEHFNFLDNFDDEFYDAIDYTTYDDEGFYDALDYVDDQFYDAIDYGIYDDFFDDIDSGIF